MNYKGVGKTALGTPVLLKGQIANINQTVSNSYPIIKMKSSCGIKNICL